MAYGDFVPIQDARDVAFSSGTGILAPSPLDSVSVRMIGEQQFIDGCWDARHVLVASVSVDVWREPEKEKTMDRPSLPQKDRSRVRRRSRLQETREDYDYDYLTLPPLAFIDEVPRGEGFSIGFNIGFLDVVAQIGLNLAGAKFHQIFDWFDDLGDYSDLFPVLQDPSVMSTWQMDSVFARQRIDGVNPVVLRQVRDLEEIGGLTDPDNFKAHIGQDLAATHDKGYLYSVEYPLLRDLPKGSWDGRRKFLPSPRALFAWVPSGYRDRGELVPVAIEHDAQGEVVVVTPEDHSRWTIAKLLLQVADGNHHEMSTHLCRTHMVMEPFAIATPRQLARNHPINLLLEPHLRFLLARNEEARNRLIKPGTYVDILLGSSLAGSLEIVQRSYAEWNFRDHAFPREIASRGTDNSAQLPDYPYRDDGMLHWNAIVSYVEQYCAIYYAKDTDIVEDFELQAWADEIVNQGRIKNLTEDGKLDTRTKLREILTQVIFTCSVQHSAVNFTQWDYMGFVPNMPLALFREPTVGETNILDYLPPQWNAAKQLEVMGGLALYRHDRLGDYDDQFEGDPRALRVLRAYQSELSRIEVEIHRRNQGRRVPYPYMLPPLVINGISV